LATQVSKDNILFIWDNYIDTFSHPKHLWGFSSACITMWDKNSWFSSTCNDQVL